jgi:hypothetical protein
MSRKSRADLAVIPFALIERPAPPADLLPAEAALWKVTVKAMRPRHFTPETHPLLRCYVHTTSMCEHFAARLREAPDDRKLLSVYDQTSRNLIAIARALRLTPRSNRLGKDDVRDARRSNGSRAHQS